jgi:hypothetical protein
MNGIVTSKQNFGSYRKMLQNYVVVCCQQGIGAINSRAATHKSLFIRKYNGISLG